jgi:hypothetical protein
MADAKRAFMDGIDWQHHVGADASGVPLFASPEGARRGKNCLAKDAGCGIVEVEIRLVRWVEPQDLGREVNKAT